jgi:ABC-type multidrug transport system ATPase subunit
VYQKSTLLKMIADTLHKSKSTVVGGKVSISGISPGKGVNWTKLVSYIDQIDRLHPFLTVKETLSFAWKCRTGGTHRLDADDKDPETEKIIADMDKQEYQVATVMEALGLTRVKDTFVGDQDRVRGVSGGEKKRVTVGEMFCCPTMVRCCDEISTGLDGEYN